MENKNIDIMKEIFSKLSEKNKDNMLQIARVVKASQEVVEQTGQSVIKSK